MMECQYAFFDNSNIFCNTNHGATSTKKTHLFSYLYLAYVILSWSGKNRFERFTYNVHKILMNVGSDSITNVYL